MESKSICSQQVTHRKKFSPPATEILFFWIACVMVIIGFLIQDSYSYLLFIFVIPIIYGSHEAIHDTLVPRKGIWLKGRQFHNVLAMCIGYSLLGMNYLLIKPSHLAHHKYGRLKAVLVPEIKSDEQSTVLQNFGYYLSLIGFSALSWQGAGFAMIIIPRKFIPITESINFQKIMRFRLIVVQIIVVIIIGIMALSASFIKITIYFLVANLIWSLLQNIGHYGIKGTNPQTNWACSHTYILSRLLRIFTFGATSHLVHHVFPNIPGAFLHTDWAIEATEERLSIKFKIEYGVLSLIRGTIQQFEGLKSYEALSTDWITGNEREQHHNS